MECHFCFHEPSDWCPACHSLLCDEHSRHHAGSFDQRCTQGGPMFSENWVEHVRQLDNETLDHMGIDRGRLGLTSEGFRSVHRCVDCGHVFTVTGPASINFGNGCLADECPSYDISRDVDMFFEPAFEAGIIRRQSYGDTNSGSSMDT